MVITKTPLRISFFGGGTDYPAWFRRHGGAVLSTTIDKYSYITARHLPPFFAHKNLVVWSKIEKTKHRDEIEHPSVKKTLEYLNMDGLGIHYDGDLPARTGLGSSSAFTVGLLHALYALKGEEASKHKIAHDAIHIEQNLLQENVGSQDQVAAAFGGLNRIEFYPDDTIRVTPLAVDAGRLERLQQNLMLVFTGFERTASDVAGEQVQNTHAHAREEELRAMHGIVDKASAVLTSTNGDLDDFGRLLDESWQIKKTLSSKITNGSIDGMYERARASGAIGGKLLGAGGGGFMLLYARPENQARVKDALKGFLHVPFRFDTTGSQVIHQTA